MDKMYQEFMEAMSKSLNGLEFTFLSKKNDSSDAEIYPPCCQFSKLDGSLLYFVNIYNTDFHGMDIADYKKRLAENAEIFASENQINGVAAFEIFAGSSGVADITETHRGEMIFINYIVNLNNKTVRVNDNSPYNKQNMREVIEAALEGRVFEPPKIEFKRKKAGFEWLSYGLIAVNAIIFLLTELAGGSSEAHVLLNFGALDRSSLINDFQLYRIITYMFLHSGPAHFANNAFWLFIIGTAAEKTFGMRNYAAIYFVSGIMAGLITVAFQNVAIVGASGALFGLMGAMVVYSYISKRTNFGFNFMLLLMVSIISVFSGFLYEGVGNLGHISGLLTGAVIGIILCKSTATKRH